MHSSTVTVKGQTTIPQEIRDYLKLRPQDKIVYMPDGKRVYLAAIHGTILDCAGSVKHGASKPLNFHQLREEVKTRVAKDIAESP